MKLCMVVKLYKNFQFTLRKNQKYVTWPVSDVIIISFSWYMLNICQLSLLSSFLDQFGYNLVQRVISSSLFQYSKNSFIKMSHDQPVTSYVIFSIYIKNVSFVSIVLISGAIWIKFGTEVYFKKVLPKIKKIFS